MEIVVESAYFVSMVLDSAELQVSMENHYMVILNDYFYPKIKYLYSDGRTQPNWTPKEDFGLIIIW